MQHIKYTYVDAVTGVPVSNSPASNGPAQPSVIDLQFVWARESRYPTDVPELFGTCPDASDIDVPGVFGVFSQYDFENMRADELAARAAVLNTSNYITKLAFRNRFTTAEKVMLEIASLDNPQATMPQRQQAAALRVNLADTAAAVFIDTKRPDTRAGVLQLEAAGLLAAGRGLEILDAPVQPVERPAA